MREGWGCIRQKRKDRNSDTCIRILYPREKQDFFYQMIPPGKKQLVFLQKAYKLDTILSRRQGFRKRRDGRENSCNQLPGKKDFKNKRFLPGIGNNAP
ncbi:MAG: hypothetical protein B6D35_00455 [Candidatus Brocadia sp. UTAMX2]|nr:MAG: hypothetical protein B6D35_00455 [Candidatus Brocadia sp. UTAMX2]